MATITHKIPSEKTIDPKYQVLGGFILGAALMAAAVNIFEVNWFDFLNMQRGVRLILTGVNPWAEATRIEHFFNPPFSVLFLWPMLFLSPKIYLIIGSGLLFAFVFYHRCWVALAWFATNTILWIIGSGGIDMVVIGGGLMLLALADHYAERRAGLLYRVLAYGLLMVKPQGGIFIVALYILTRKDWKGFLVSCLVYGLPFIPLYRDWLYVLTHFPPLSHTEATHTLLERFGPWAAIFVALLVMLSRKWQYWQLGGALSGILAPYGMPGVPIFVILTAVRARKAALIVVIYSACLAAMTWISALATDESFHYFQAFMAIYHVGMLGLALILAIMDPAEGQEGIDIQGWIRNRIHLKHAQ